MWQSQSQWCKLAPQIANHNPPETARAGNITRKGRTWYFPISFSVLFMPADKLSFVSSFHKLAHTTANWQSCPPRQLYFWKPLSFPQITTWTAVLENAEREFYLGSRKGLSCCENEDPSWYRDLGAIVFNLSLSLSDEWFFLHWVAIVSDFRGSLAAGYYNVFICPYDFMMCTVSEFVFTVYMASHLPYWNSCNYSLLLKSFLLGVPFKFESLKKDFKIPFFFFKFNI